MKKEAAVTEILMCVFTLSANQVMIKEKKQFQFENFGKMVMNKKEVKRVHDPNQATKPSSPYSIESYVMRNALGLSYYFSISCSQFVS